MRDLVNAAMSLGPAAVILVVLAVFVLPLAVRILREYERGVIFRLGKLLDAKGPGLIFLIPLVDKMVRMDLRIVTIGVTQQEIMTRDNVPATVDAVVYFRIINPSDAVVKVEDFLKATSLIAQTTLRSVLGQASLDDLLSQRDVINKKLQEIIDRQTEPWGIKVTAVEVKDVSLPDSMKRAMAKQAEAERERRAKVVNAEGEFEAAEKMVQAASMIAKEPIALQLRYLQTMSEIASEHNTTTFLPLPIELFRTREVRCADEGPCRERPRRSRFSPCRFHKPEVDYLRENLAVTLAHEHQIRRLDVPVDKLLFLCRDERTGDLLCDVESEETIERSIPFDPGKDRLAVYEFHRVKVTVAVLPKMEHRRHISMPQPCGGSRLALKTIGRALAVQQIGCDDFQGDVAVQVGIEGFICDPHRAAPQLHERAIRVCKNLIMLELQRFRHLLKLIIDDLHAVIYAPS